MFQFVLGANLAVDVSRSSHGMFVYEYLSCVVDDSSAASLRATGSVRLMESPGAAKAGTEDSVMAAPRAAAPAALAATLPATCGWFGASAAAPIASASTTFIVACAHSCRHGPSRGFYRGCESWLRGQRCRAASASRHRWRPRSRVGASCWCSPENSAPARRVAMHRRFRLAAREIGSIEVSKQPKCQLVL